MHWHKHFVVAVVFCAALTLVGCGGGGQNPSSTGFVNLSISDPPTCSAATNGPFLHVYVTITDVQISTNATAGDNDSSWVDLTPTLKTSPVQVDLLGSPNGNCILAALGNNVQIAAGTYQQIRLILADNNASVSGNKCTGATNCVVASSDPQGTNPIPLQLSSESRTGIKIPSGQIAGGQFTVPAGQTRDLNVDFDCCASIVSDGNGRLRLKPVLHAGEVSLAQRISGTLVDSLTRQAIPNLSAVVALEQRDSAGVDRVILQTKADSSGNFILCPVPTGTYDVVVVAISGANAYATTVTTGVAAGTTMGNVPLVAVTGLNTAPASLGGQVTTSKTPAAAAPADVTLSALQDVTGGAVTIPLAQQSSATVNLATAAGVACVVNVACANFTLSVPPANPSVGAFSATGTSYAQASGNVEYTVEALAFVPQSGGTADCSPPRLTSAKTAVTAGANVSVGTLAFSGCQ